jgi:hypothetical protein
MSYVLVSDVLWFNKKVIDDADGLLTCSMHPHKNITHGYNLFYLLYAYKIAIASEIFPTLKRFVSVQNVMSIFLFPRHYLKILTSGGPCAHSNEVLGSIKDREFLE